MLCKRRLKAVLNTRVFKLVTAVLLFICCVTVMLPNNETNVTKSNIDGKTESKLKTFLLIFIMTGPKNDDRRNAIRETWLNFENKDDSKHFFVIGTKNLPINVKNDLEIENQRHSDLMLLEQFEDSYDKLTEKLGLMLEWASDNVDFRFLFKADDDTFVRVDKIVQDLKNDKEKYLQQFLYWGYFYGRAHVKKTGPWKELNWQLCDYYLPYARGGGYILSSAIVSYIAKNWRIFEKYVSEDVTLGAWVAPLKVKRIHDTRFDTEYKTRGCKNSFTVSHKQSIGDMQAKYSSLMATGNLCTTEIVNFYGYQYDWDVPPSKCCVRSSLIP
uniref:Hexosyltransferase n=1 Tax=Ciona intestinalis TaxID=7719 RepID=Q256Z9_CIOIN|nr:beta-1,3-galactosyltransferase 6 [Ciona intestinalis]CAJ84709.1 beta-1,3-galactosyltransferase 6 [Ciona intestinalis]|eukprot:NP_001072016.1 beta-1,3-galactosyltransferase 6 [Ciona intestinalis]